MQRLCRETKLQDYYLGRGFTYTTDSDKMRQGRKAIPKSSRKVLLSLSNFRAQKEQEYLIFVGHPEVSRGGCSEPKATLPGAPDTQGFLAATKGNRAIAWHTKNPFMVLQHSD